jgi:hypothetical protein
MTRDEIIKGMGWPAFSGSIPDDDDLIGRIESIVRSAEAAEREACISDCNAEARDDGTAQKIVAAIRARGEK